MGRTFLAKRTHLGESLLREHRIIKKAFGEEELGSGWDRP